MRRTGAHARSKLRLDGRRGVVLVDKPREEASLGIVEELARRALIRAEQGHQFARQRRRCWAGLDRSLGRRDHLLGLFTRLAQGPDRRSHQRQEARFTASFIASLNDTGQQSSRLRACSEWADASAGRASRLRRHRPPAVPSTGRRSPLSQGSLTDTRRAQVGRPAERQGIASLSRKPRDITDRKAV